MHRRQHRRRLSEERPRLSDGLLELHDAFRLLGELGAVLGAELAAGTQPLSSLASRSILPTLAFAARASSCAVVSCARSDFISLACVVASRERISSISASC